MSLDASDFYAVAVGNTRTRLGIFRSGKLEGARTLDPASLKEDVGNAISELGKAGAAVVGSVHDANAVAVEAVLDALGIEVFRLGRDLEIPIHHALDDASTVGHDRLLCALGAFELAKQACVVVDAGTAITVDFVDGEGTFQGGAISPGVGMMLSAMHEQTHALPMVHAERVDASRPFGKSTIEAMRLGVQASGVGVVHHLLGRYAEAYGAYPVVVATGGDAPFLFDNDELVEHVSPDLQLLGIRVACSALLEEERGAQD